ncbi:hypothetical protein HDU76_010208 [Blyttiomyces sp. JEL0837]|nr:hypothetical protein HDU76_010208 [Blyttiomyces sp. JEL0837]
MKVDFHATFDQLRKALASIYSKSGCETFIDPFQQVYNMCTAYPKPFDDALFEAITIYLTEEVTQTYRVSSSPDVMMQVLYQLRRIHPCQTILDNDDFVHSYAGEWERFRVASGYVDKICDYLNRRMAKKVVGIQRRGMHDGMYPKQSIESLAFAIWKDQILYEIKVNHANRLVARLLDLIEEERNGRPVPTDSICKAIASLVEVNVYADPHLQLYVDMFEQPFLDRTRSYYQSESNNVMSSSDVSGFMKKAFDRLEEESTRIRKLCHSSSYTKAMKECEAQYIALHQSRILADFQSMVEKERIHDCSLAYELLTRIEHGLDPVLVIFENYITSVGRGISSRMYETAAKDPRDYIETLASLHEKYLTMCNNVFKADSLMIASVDKAFTTFINERNGTNASPFSELLAKYCDLLLKKSNKAVVSDSDVEDKLSRVIDDIWKISVFKYIEDKDVFQKFYSRLLAKRLIYAMSISDDAESNMLSRLKAACGVEYTTKLQRMFTDVAVSSDMTKRFAYSLQRSRTDLGVDFNIIVMTAGSWPMSGAGSSDFPLPDELVRSVAVFNDFYINSHSGRKITWLFHLSRGKLPTTLAGYMESNMIVHLADVKVNGFDRKYELNISLHQLILLLLFNQTDTVTADMMLSHTKFTDAELKRTIKPLLDLKLIIGSEREYKLNLEFTSKRTKIKVTAATSFEANHEADSTRKAIDEDRRLFLQAVIVRVMKSRRELSHTHLVQEVINLSKARFLPPVPLIKKCVEQLIEKGYLDRSKEHLDHYVQFNLKTARLSESKQCDPYEINTIQEIMEEDNHSTQQEEAHPQEEVASSVRGSTEEEEGRQSRESSHDGNPEVTVTVEGENEANDQQVGEEAGDAVPALAQQQAFSASTDWIDRHELEYLEQKEKRKKLLQGALLDKTKVPASYYTTSKKESLILQYVENFNRQYVQLYPGRKELLLCPENEFAVKKFVCTTIRPCQLPFKELYDYRSCAKFVADYLNYEPLEPPHELVMGFGYDAYVVSGYASREITVLDETRTDSDTVGIPSPAKPPTANATTVNTSQSEDDKLANTGRYKVKPPRQLRSQFLLKQEEKRKALALKEQELKRLEMEKEKAFLVEDDDELKGLRIHAWVLVLPGKREVAENFFIEPSTGRIYSTENENYLGVESIFSSTNYWVNMQVCYDGLKGIQFDLGDNSKWEFVLLDNTQPGGNASKGNDDGQNNDNASDDEEEEEANLEILDLPPSWVERLSLTREQFESKCPAGSKTVVYKNARVVSYSLYVGEEFNTTVFSKETFAEYHRTDGMISRVTFFTDESKDFNGQIREYFANRRLVTHVNKFRSNPNKIFRDKLRERIRYPDTGTVHEFFDPGRPHGLKEHVMVEGQTTEIFFYPSSRSDGLLKRMEKENKVIELFTEREDKLVYRSVTFEVGDGIDDERHRDHNIVLKMTEKFERNLDVPAHEDPAKKTYFAKEDKIKVVYHLEEGRIISSYREFKKPSTDQKANALEVPTSFEVPNSHVNPYIKPPKKQHLYAQLCELLRSEQACLQAVKAAEREVKEILQARILEEKDVALVVSVYDTIRNNTRLPSEEEKENHKGEEEEAKASDLDYLSPFLVNYVNPSALVREEALQVKEACLKSLKERLIEKANIIQSRLEEVTQEYQRRQLAYSRNADSMTVEETDEYVRFCNDALFKIHILEMRLAKHKEAAPERYIELDAKLRSDPRLKIAFAS